MKTYITNDTQNVGLPADKLLNFPDTINYEGVPQNKYDGCTVYIIDKEG